MLVWGVKVLGNVKAETAEISCNRKRKKERERVESTCSTCTSTSRGNMTSATAVLGGTMERKGTAEVADCNVTCEVRPGYLDKIGQIVPSISCSCCADWL